MASIIIPGGDRETYAENIFGFQREVKRKKKLNDALTDPTTYITASINEMDNFVVKPVKTLFKDVYGKLIEGEGFPEDEARERAIQLVLPYKNALMDIFKELYPDTYQELAVKQSTRASAAKALPISIPSD